MFSGSRDVLKFVLGDILRIRSAIKVQGCSQDRVGYQSAGMFQDRVSYQSAGMFSRYQSTGMFQDRFGHQQGANSQD
jgi:hypothetical protein